MKQFLQLIRPFREMRNIVAFSFVLFALIAIPMGMKGQTVVTFTPGTDSGATSVTKGDITATMTTMNNASYYQIYANQSGTFSTTNGVITKIEFTCTASGTSKYGPGNASSTVGSYSYSEAVGTWTGSETSVTISSTAQVRMSSLEITYTPAGGGQTTTYTVTYHANVTGATDIVETYNEGADVTVAANTFSNPGYAFTEWNTEADGTGTDYQPGAVIEDIDNDWDFYAQWEESDEVTATLTASNLELTTSYLNESVTKTIDGITYEYYDLMKNSNNIQAKASSGTIKNTTAYPGDITSVVITHSGTARATTVNGSADGTNWTQVATGSGSITADFSGHGYKYFQITRGSNAAYWTKIEITYSTNGSSQSQSDLAITNASTDLTFDLYNNSTAQVINYTTSSTGAITISPASPTEYFSYVHDATAKTITVTPLAVTPSTQTITINQEADDDYYAGTATFTVSVANSTPLANIAALTSQTTAGNYSVTLSDAVVTYVNGNNAYIQDASGAVAMYKSEHGLTAGDVFNGTATVAYKLRNDNPQITDLTDVTPVSGTAPDPTEVAQSAWSYTFSNVLSQYFKVTGATITQSSNKYYVSLGGDSIQLYKTGSSISTLDLTKMYSITGFPTMYNTTKELTIYADPEVEASTEPSVTVTPNTINAPAEGADSTLALTYENITDFISFDYYFCDAEGEELLDTDPNYPDWIDAEINEDNDTYSLDYLIDANNGAARTAYIKVYTFDEDLEEVYAIVTVNQAQYVVDYAVLPFEWEGGERSEFDALNGTSTYSVGDYAVNQGVYRMKLDLDGDYIQVKTDSRPGVVTINVKMIGGSTASTITVQGSSDGENFTDIQNLTISGSQNSELTLETTNVFGENDRYVRLYFTKGSNVGVGPITIAKYTEPVIVASITVDPATVNVDATPDGEDYIEGTMDLTWDNLDITDFFEDFAVQYYDAEGEELTDADAPDWIVVELATQDPNIGEGYLVSYMIDVNEGTEARTAYFKVFALGDEDYVYSNLVTITQAAPVVPSTPGNWVLTNLSDLTEDDIFVIVGTYEDVEYDSYALPNDGGASSSPTAVAVIVVENALSEEPAANLQWNLKITDDGYIFYPNGITESWLYCTSSNSGVRVGTNTNNVFVLDDESNYLKNVATSRFLGIYNSQDWRCYTSINTNIEGQTFAFYKKVEDVGPFTVTLTYADGTTAELTGGTDGTVTLPEADVPQECGQNLTFAGWSASEINGVSVYVPSDLVTAGPGYTPSEDVRLYAVYTKTGEGEIYSYQKVTGTVSVGDVVYLVCEDAQKEFQKIEESKGVGLTYDGSIDGKHKFTVMAGEADGTYALKDVYNKYLSCTGDNSLSLATTMDANSSWTITTDNGNAVVSNGTYTIVWDGDNFVGVANAEVQMPVQLLKAVAGPEVAYTTAPECNCSIVLTENSTYSEDFESYYNGEDGVTGIQPQCWALKDQFEVMSERDVPQLYRENGNSCLHMNFRVIYAMPALSLPAGKTLKDVRMEFDLRQTNLPYYKLQVGVLEANGMFVPLSEITNSTTGEEHYTTDFSGYEGDGGLIAFKNIVAGIDRHSWNFIDNIELSLVDAVTCTGIQSDYSEDFEGITGNTAALTGVGPACWEVVRVEPGVTLDLTTKPQIHYTGDDNNPYDLQMTNRCVYAMPALAEEVALNTLQMTFRVKQHRAIYTLQVGVWEEGNDGMGTFVPMTTVNNSSTDYETVTLDFATYNGSGNRIAFRNTLSGGPYVYSYNYIDDITLSPMVTQECSGIPENHSEDFTGWTTSEVVLTGVEPDCWEVVREDAALNYSTKPQIHYTGDDNNPYDLQMTNRCVYAMPALAEEVALNTLQMTFRVKQHRAIYTLQVGVWEEGNDGMGTFVPMTTVNNSSTDYETVTLDFATYNGSGNRIAFRNTLSGGPYVYSYNYIDDITLSPMETQECQGIEADHSEEFNGWTTKTVALTGAEPDCWDVVREDASLNYSTKPQIHYTGDDNNPYDLQMTNRCVYAMPALAEDVLLNTLQMTFKVKQHRTIYTLQVGVWEEGNDGSGTFVPMMTVNNTTTSDYETITLDFGTYTGNGNRIAFRNTLSGGPYAYSYNYIDDIILSSGETLDESKISETSDANVIDEIGVERYLEGIAVYPNPTTGMLYIDAMDVQKVECYNQMGQLVGVYDNANELNISELSNGVYILRITVPQGVTMRKVVKR